ncbi:MAG: GNAT family N-acetyltransferase [Alphaproteobacteria bacterium]|nr:GNAT family N-acetyltransferase [Alphaproteobacteria bacterium]
MQNTTDFLVRAGQADDLDSLAQLWFDGWQDGHAKVTPPELIKLRTIDSFRDRLAIALPNTRVVGPPDKPLGFVITQKDELYQLFVSATARGTGIAACLINDGLHSIKQRGFQTAWLACAIGNDRAARFYEKSGWHRSGIITTEVETMNGPYPLDVWKYERDLNTI